MAGNRVGRTGAAARVGAWWLLLSAWLTRVYRAARGRMVGSLLESDHRLLVLSDAVRNYAIFHLDPHGTVLSWDSAAERLKGYRADEIIGQNFSRFYPQRDIDQGVPKQHLDAAAISGRVEVEQWRVRKDGTEFWAIVVITAVRNASGTLLGFDEVSRRVNAREELAAKYLGLLEAAPDAMVVVNAEGIIVLVNTQAERQFGYPRHELVGHAVTEIIPQGFAERLVADDTRTTADALAQQIGTGLELTGRRKDGSEYPIEIMLSPLESVEGILVTAAIRNITARRTAEAHPVQMESRYRTLLEAAPDAIVVVDENGTIVLVNLEAERQFGYSRAELVGMAMTEIIPQGFAEQLLADSPSTEASAKPIATGLEPTGRRKDGGEFPIEIMLSPLESADGILVTATIRNITAAREAALQLTNTVTALRRSNEELAQFAQVASHDLQEPLRMVASYTQLLAKRYKGRLDADADEFISYAVDGSNRMQRLIQDLLAYSRAGLNGQPLRQIESETALTDALHNLRVTIDESAAVVSHDPLPVLTTDLTVLTQVLQNLIGNAIKYHGGAAPRVHVSAANHDGSEWIFSVQDNGLGIEPRYFDRIFVIFQRLHGPTEFQGTGIGLAICKKMITGLGGRIWVESEPASGSTFHFALPAGEPQ